MKQVLILANNDVGLYKFRKELIQELVKNYEVYISLPYGEFVPHLKEIGCKFIDTEISRRGTNPITDLKLILNYRKMISKINPDVVLTYTIKPNVYGGLACRMNSVPYIANITGLGTAVENGGILQKVTLFLYKVALKKAKCVFFQNEENRDFFIKKGVVNSGGKLIPGSGVNLHYYSLLDYPLDNDVVNFVFIARVMKEKGIDQYIEAAVYIKSKYPKTNFHVCGFCEGEYEDTLNKLNKKGIIIYHGMINNIKDILGKTHCTIHPTYYPEGLSNVLLESAASGRPIITTDRSGCREVVEHGVNGLLVKSKNSNDLIKKIENFLALSYEEKKVMGVAGRNKVEKEFDRNIVVSSYLSEIQLMEFEEDD